MKIRALVLLLVSMYSLSAFAQNTWSVKGSVADTTSQAKLVNATITILNSKDSIFYKFSRTAADGSFSINGMAAGNYLLLVSYHGYADYMQQVTLDSINKTHDFGRIYLILKSKLLEEVVVNTAAIIIKGDTTVFNAASYKVQPNAKVEDLLKQFPGLQVDQRGTITAYGQQVKKVLVDGEEFFSSDPTLVTRNIRADMVSRIELFDKKSDKAEFSGVDDGQRTTTLNVILKDNSKNGYFGKASGGESPDLATYNAQAMANSFTPVTKISAFITAGNTNGLGLNYQDNSKLGVPSERPYDADGNLIENPGLLTSRNGGLHFDTKWNNKKETINLNYITKYLGSDLLQTTLRQNNLPGETINGDENLNRDNSNSGQRFDATYNANYDVNTVFKIIFNGSLNHNNGLSKYSTLNSIGNNVKLNSGNRTLTNAGEQKAFYLELYLQRRFKKTGRFLYGGITQSLNRDHSSDYVYSANNFYDHTGTLDSTSIIDQYKPVVYKNYSFSGSVSYNEPVSKNIILSLYYYLSYNNSSNNRESFNKSTLGKYDLKDNIYSNNINADLLRNRLTTELNYRKDKVSMRLSGSAAITSQKQADLNTGKEYDRNYLNWTTGASYQYAISAQRSFSLGYFGFVEQPSIEQIQPIKSNVDPLFITSGNPDLKSYLENHFTGTYSSVKPLTGSSFRMDAGYTIASNKIVYKTVTDAAGKTAAQYVNLKGKTPMSYSLNFNLGNKLKKSDIRINVSWGSTGYVNYNYINGAINKNQRLQFNFLAGTSKTKVNKYDFNMKWGPTYYINSSSLQPQLKNNGFGIKGENALNIYLPGKMQIGTIVNYNYNQGSKAFNYNDEISIISFNASISKRFLKTQNLVLSCSGNDLLNQDMGYKRNMSVNNIFSQTTANVINRYLMFSLTWDFTRKGKVISAPAPSKN